MTEVSKCKTCGCYDCIYHTSDAGVCMECGTPEDYTTVLIDENGNEIEEPNPITGKQIDEMGEYYESD